MAIHLLAEDLARRRWIELFVDGHHLEALRHGQRIPRVGLDVVALQAPTLLIHGAHDELGGGVPLAGRLHVPFDGHAVVVGDAAAIKIKFAEGKLGLGMVADICGQAIPLRRPEVVLLNAFADLVQLAEPVAGGGVPLAGGLGVPPGGGLGIGGHATALLIEPAEGVLGLGIATFGQRHQGFEARRLLGLAGAGRRVVAGHEQNRRPSQQGKSRQHEQEPYHGDPLYPGTGPWGEFSPPPAANAGAGRPQGPLIRLWSLLPTARWRPL